MLLPRMSVLSKTCCSDNLHNTRSTGGTYIIGKEYTTRHRRKPGYSAAIGVPTISPSEDLHFPSAQNNADFVKVTYRYYIGMLGFLSEDYVKVRSFSILENIHIVLRKCIV